MFNKKISFAVSVLGFALELRCKLVPSSIQNFQPSHIRINADDYCGSSKKKSILKFT